VSILVLGCVGDGRCQDVAPASNVSIMYMRPPQHGHGVARRRGSSAADLAGSGLDGGGVTLSSSRADAFEFEPIGWAEI
jgi:hypothetical protein